MPNPKPYPNLNLKSLRLEQRFKKWNDLTLQK